jgi:hypothetical protein
VVILVIVRIIALPVVAGIYQLLVWLVVGREMPDLPLPSAWWPIRQR